MPVAPLKRLSNLDLHDEDITPPTSQEQVMFKALLEANDHVLANVLIFLYNRQTEVEQQQEGTIERNSRGFNGVDGQIFTSFSKQLISRGYLSPKQLDLCRKKLPKYWKQVISFFGDNWEPLCEQGGYLHAGNEVREDN